MGHEHTLLVPALAGGIIGEGVVIFQRGSIGGGECLGRVLAVPLVSGNRWGKTCCGQSAPASQERGGPLCARWGGGDDGATGQHQPILI